MPKAYYFCLDIHGSRWKSGSELRSASNACCSESKVCQSCLESSLQIKIRIRVKFCAKGLLLLVGLAYGSCLEFSLQKRVTIHEASNACCSKSTICHSCLESSLHTELRCRIKVIIKCLLEYVNAYKYQEQSLCFLEVNNSYENADLASRHQVRQTHVSSLKTGFFIAAYM